MKLANKMQGIGSYWVYHEWDKVVWLLQEFT